jgi:3-(3-hydroxy-phenyl)propionate hydroxylase
MSANFVSYFDYTHFPPVLPPLQGGRAKRARVTLAGGGPIGFTLALALAKHGIPSVVLEADDSVCTGSRAGCITRRTLEIFEQLGIAAPCMEQGLPWHEGWSYHRDKPVLHMQYPPDAGSRFPALVNIQQCYVEQYMVDAIAAFGDLIDVRWQNRLAAIRPSESGCALEVETPSGSYAMDSDWVVACDGARSFVRSALDLRMEGTRYEARYIIVDIRMASSLPPGRRAWFDPPSNPGATLLLHKHKEDLWRFDYQLRDDEDEAEAVKPENVLARVQSHLDLMGERAHWDPVWISTYRASALTLDRYRHGRVLLAGDAAHLVPIFGVRGMNSGVDDAHNLAWKLAAVLRGDARESLLDSYSDERVAATRENIRNASKSAEFMDPPTPAFRLMRDAVLGLAETSEWVRPLVDWRASTAVGFPDSPLNVAGDGAQFAAGPAAGMNLPDARLQRDGQAAYLSSLAGPGFAAVTFTAPGNDEISNKISHLCYFKALLATHCIAPPGHASAGDWIDVHGEAAARLDARPGTTYLLRPDGHVLGRWRTPDAGAVREAINRCLRGGAAG